MIDLLQILLLFLACYPIVLGFGGLGFNCCCDACLIYEDAFSGTDEGGWTQASGTWTEDSGYMATASSSAKLTCDTTHPDAVPSHYVHVDMYGTSGDQLKVHVGTNHFAQLTIGSPNGCLELYDGGTLLTKMLVDAPATTPAQLKVWYGQTPVADGNDSQFAAQWNGGTILRYNVTRAGNGVALGTGTVGSTVRFDNFRYEKHYTSTLTHCPKPAAPTCLILTDTFGRADDTNVGCSWTETSGGAAIVTNKVRFAASANAKLTCEVRHPQGSSAVEIEAVVRSSASGDEIKVWTSTVDNHYAKLTIGTNTLKIYRAGAEVTSVAVTANTNTDYTLRVVQAGGILSAQVGTICASHGVLQPAGSVYVGVGTGTCTGNVDIDSIAFNRGYDSNNVLCAKSCISCANVCDDTRRIRSIVVRFNGFTNTALCSDCPDWDDIDIELPFYGGVNPTIGCTWLSNCATPSVCGDPADFLPSCTASTDGVNFTTFGIINCEVNIVAGTLSIQIQDNGVGVFAVWSAPFTFPVDCDAEFTMLALGIPDPPYDTFGDSGIQYCVGDNATCTIVGVIYE